MSVNTQYAVTQYPTPVFNTPDISTCFGGADGDSLPLDSQELMRTMETVLFPQTKVILVEEVAQSIWKIQTDEYNYGGQYYIDGRFIQRHHHGILPNRMISVPSLPSIISKLNQLVGTRYFWGGNWPEGIDLMPRLYRSRSPLNRLSSMLQDNWQLKGVDCSGLFYYVSDGFTARNTSKLLDFGRAVLIEGLSLHEIIDKVNDLDLIVWKGHVVGVLDHKTTIESQSPKGVVTYDLKSRLLEIMNKRKPVNRWDENEGSGFVIRRWHPDNL